MKKSPTPFSHTNKPTQSHTSDGSKSLYQQCFDANDIQINPTPVPAIHPTPFSQQLYKDIYNGQATTGPTIKGLYLLHTTIEVLGRVIQAGTIDETLFNRNKEVPRQRSER